MVNLGVPGQEKSPEPLSGEVVRMLTSKMTEEEEEEPETPGQDFGDKRLSDLAELLFMVGLYLQVVVFRVNYYH